MKLRSRTGLTLVETALSVAVGLVVVAGSIAAYNQINKSAKFSQAKTMVGTIQTNIGMDKFRLGSPVPLSSNQAATPSTFGIQINMDSVGNPYYRDSQNTNALPNDPVMGKNTIMSYTYNASPVALSPGAPSAQWDNPVFGSPAYGQGGWLYDASTGNFRINLSNQTYPEHRPGAW